MVKTPLATRICMDISLWRGDIEFMFEWQEQYLTSERSARERKIHISTPQ